VSESEGVGLRVSELGLRVSGFGGPAVLVIEGGGGGERHFDVPALDSKVEARLLVLHELQRHLPPERDFFSDNLQVRIHFIIVMIRWTGLAPWECGWGGDLGEALLLEVSDDGLAAQLRPLDDLQHLRYRGTSLVRTRHLP